MDKTINQDLLSLKEFSENFRPEEKALVEQIENFVNYLYQNNYIDNVKNFLEVAKYSFLEFNLEKMEYQYSSNCLYQDINSDKISEKLINFNDLIFSLFAFYDSKENRTYLDSYLINQKLNKPKINYMEKI